MCLSKTRLNISFDFWITIKIIYLNINRPFKTDVHTGILNNDEIFELMNNFDPVKDFSSKSMPYITVHIIAVIKTNGSQKSYGTNGFLRYINILEKISQDSSFCG